MANQEVIEGTQSQSTDEKVSYKLTTTNWGSNPTDVSVTAFDETIKTTCTSTVFPINEPSVNGDVITLSPLQSLGRNSRYKIEIKFTVDGNTLECFFWVDCTM